MLVKNCFNYVGSKDRIFPIIDENLDKNKRYFFDVFCGGAVVGINEISNYHKIYLNDVCWQLIETMKYFRDTDWETLIGEIDVYIQEYELSKENKEGYLTLRDYYNINHSQKENFNPALFYAMLTHSFNYLIGINKSGGYNVPFGKNRSCFSSALRTKLENFHKVIHENRDKITIGSEDFLDLIHRADKVIPNSMFYLDPPYLASDSSYNRVCYAKWDNDKEQKLYEALDFINDKGGSFLLSNVMENNGTVNETLIKWAEKYTVVDISADYSNCNYQRKNLGNTKEVVVRNYDIN